MTDTKALLERANIAAKAWADLVIHGKWSDAPKHIEAGAQLAIVNGALCAALTEAEERAEKLTTALGNIFAADSAYHKIGACLDHDPMCDAVNEARALLPTRKDQPNGK